MFPVWQADSPLRLQPGELCVSEGKAYRALIRITYALPQCDPAHPMGCDWFSFEGDCSR